MTSKHQGFSRIIGSGELRRAALLLGSCLLFTMTDAAKAITAADSSVMAAYTLITPNDESASSLIARAIVPSGIGCPSLKVKIGSTYKHLSMTERAAPANTFSAFSSLAVCEALMPKSALSAQVGDQTIPAHMPAIIKRMGVFGDTGCRMKKTLDQVCDTPSEWPLSQIANSLVKQKPQVVLFMGDFFYREYICDPSKTLICGTSPAPLDINFEYNSVTNPFPKYVFSDSDYAWVADVFIPMKPILSLAPIVVVRGNHESCQRGGNGFFKFFDPHLGNEQLCAPQPKTDATGAQIITNGHPQWKTADQLLTNSWSTSFKVGASRYLRLSIVDSAYGFDYEVDPVLYPALRTQYESAAELASPKHRVKGRVPENWLMVHQPLFGLDCAPDTISMGGANLFGDQCKWVSETQTAGAYGLLSHFNLVLSSHIHLVQSVQIPGQPGQLVIGDGGSKLQEIGAPYPSSILYGPLQYPNGNPVAGLPSGVTPYPVPTSIWTERRFGFAIAKPEASAGKWSWLHYTPEGALFAECTQSGTSINCQTLVNP